MRRGHHLDTCGDEIVQGVAFRSLQNAEGVDSVLRGC